MSDTIYFFGCWQQAGHHLWTIDGRSIYYPSESCPFDPGKLDGCLLLPYPESSGIANISVVRGWTIVSWWNRTFDTRPGTNASILVKGIHTFNEVWDLFQKNFPALLAYSKPTII